MGRVYTRGAMLWLHYKDPTGKWVKNSSGLSVGKTPEERRRQERRAHKRLEMTEAQIAAGLLPTTGGPLTVAAYANGTWIDERKLYVGSWKGDSAVLRDHVLPTIGRLPLGDVRARHLVELARDWRAKGLAPKTRYSNYSVCCALFRDAQLAGLVEQSPCVLTKRQLGEKVDKNPEWRATAVFTRDELEQLISDTRVPSDRRLLNAFAGIGRLRLGEIAGLRWRHLESTAKPLGRIIVATSYDKGRTKTQETRYMAIHPTLAAMIAEWRRVGWLEMFGRSPEPDDLVLPRDPDALKPGTMRSKQYVGHLFGLDLKALGLRHRRFHDLARTMISLSRADGAQKDILRRGTHKAPKDIMEQYTSVEWDVLCREVMKFEVHRRDVGQVIRLAANATVLGTLVHPSDPSRPSTTVTPSQSPAVSASSTAIALHQPSIPPVQVRARALDSACLSDDLRDAVPSAVPSGADELMALFSEGE